MATTPPFDQELLKGFTGSSVFCPAACRRDPLSAAVNWAKNKAAKGEIARHARRIHTADRRPALRRAAQDRYADHHQRGGDLSQESAVPRSLQSMDRELVHRHFDPLP